MNKTTNIIAASQFKSLSMQDKELYRVIRNSKIILKLRRKGYLEKHHVILNFNVIRENERVFFKFHIVESLKKASESKLLYSVKGSIFDNDNERCIIYDVNDCNNNSCTYIDNTSYISESVYLNEIFVTSENRQDLKHECASVIINPKSSDKKEFMIDLENEIFKGYLNNRISQAVLCNFVIFKSDSAKTNSQDLGRQFTKTFLK